MRAVLPVGMGDRGWWAGAPGGRTVSAGDRMGSPGGPGGGDLQPGLRGDTGDTGQGEGEGMKARLRR